MTVNAGLCSAWGHSHDSFLNLRAAHDLQQMDLDNLDPGPISGDVGGVWRSGIGRGLAHGSLWTEQDY